MQTMFNAHTTASDFPFALSTSTHSTSMHAMTVERALQSIGPTCIRTLKTGEHVYFEGTEKRQSFIVLSGVVGTYSMLDDGHRQIIAFNYPGDSLELDPLKCYTHSAVAIGSVQLRCIPTRAIERRLHSDMAFAATLWRSASSQLALTRDRIVALGAQSAAQRLAGFLLESRKARQCSSRSVYPEQFDDLITLPMKRQDIADYLGLTIETVSRNFSRMKKLGVLECLTPATLRIANRPLLEDLAHGSRCRRVA